jgi:hypothetical protein
MPIMALRTGPNWTWSNSYFYTTNNKIAEKTGEINAGISTNPLISLLINLLPSQSASNNDSIIGSQPRQWQWTCPDGDPPNVPTHYRTGHSVFTAPPRLPYHAKTTTPRHQRHALRSAHQRSIHRQTRRDHLALTAVPCFAPCDCRGSIKWLLQLEGLFPQAIRATNNKSPPVIESLPTLFDQTNAHIFEATVVLDAALRDFHGDNITGLLLAGLQHKVGGSNDDGGELAEIEREQDGLVEEGS